MAQNNFRFFYLFIILNCLLCANIFAIEDPAELEAGYFIDLSGDTPKIIHRFVWAKEEYASHYEISIQVYDGYYKDYIIENTEKTFFEVSLQPGLYRYSIASFDLLGMRAEATPWKQFEIIATHVPQIKSFFPEYFYLDRDNKRILHITGVNISKDSKIYLSDGENQLVPVDVTIINEERAEIVFDDKSLIAGEYDIFILNPSGLGTKTGIFSIGYSKPLDYFFRMSYLPAVPVYGDSVNSYGADLFLMGYSLSIELISSKRKSFNGGLELGASMFFFNSAFSDFDLNFSFQKRLFVNRAYLTFRFGMGLAYFSDFGLSQSEEIAFKVNLSFSAMFKIYKIMHIDIGADYSHYFTNEAFALIKPRIGLVWKF